MKTSCSRSKSVLSARICMFNLFAIQWQVVVSIDCLGTCPSSHCGQYCLTLCDTLCLPSPWMRLVTGNASLLLFCVHHCQLSRLWRTLPRRINFFRFFWWIRFVLANDRKCFYCFSRTEIVLLRCCSRLKDKPHPSSWQPKKKKKDSCQE